MKARCSNKDASSDERFLFWVGSQQEGLHAPSEIYKSISMDLPNPEALRTLLGSLGSHTLGSLYD